MKSQNFGKKNREIIFSDHLNLFKIYEKTLKIFFGVFQKLKLKLKYEHLS